MQEENTPPQNIQQSKPEHTTNQSQKNTEEKTKKQHKTIKWIIVAIVAVIIVVIISIFVKNSLDNSEAGMQRRLEKYATKIYNKNLKNSRNEKSLTINLNYLEKNDFDISIFDKNSCSRTDTYAVVTVDENREIKDITTKLSCGVNNNEETEEE